MVQEKKAGEKSELPRQLSLDIWGNAYARGVTGGAQRILRVLDEIGDKPDIKDFSSYSGYLEADERYQRELKRRLDYELREKPPQKAEEAAIRGTDLSWERTRRMVFERDKGICKVCGKKLDWDRNYECGHIVDRNVGGSDRLSNLVAMCSQCNAQKPMHTSKAEYDDWVEEGGPVGDISEESSVTTSARRSHAKRGIRARVERGLPPSSWPHGYRPVRDGSGKVIGGEFVPGEIEAVRLATKLFLEGKGYYSIVRALDSSPWRPRKTEHWSFGTIHKMMRNSIYAGIVHYGDARNPEPSDKFPPAWDEATYKEIVREHQRRKRGGTRPVSPVSGCVICARCGWSMSSLERKGVRYFRCSRHAAYRRIWPCHHNLIRESIVIEYLELAIAADLQRPGSIEAMLAQSGPGRATIEQEIAAIQAQMAAIEEKQYRLAVLAEDGAIDIEAARRRTGELAEQLAATDRSLKDAQERLTTLPDLDEMRRRLERVAECVDLRSKPLEEVRNHLLRAGVKVYVEDRQIVRIVFGEPLTES